jgi:hypothetical protein
MTVDYLLNNRSNYRSKTVTVRGEIKDTYHGLLMCDENGEPCISINLLENVSPNIELEQDFMYEEFKNLSLSVGSVQRTLGKAKLFATLRGRVHMETISSSGKEVTIQDPLDIRVESWFVLQEVLKIEIKAVN